MNTPFKKRGNPLTIENSKPAVAAPTNDDRVKYTATMEKDLRIQVKIASAKLNLSFSEFIEEALREKLEREGL